MRKKIFLFLVSSLLLIGCNNTTTSSSTPINSNVEETSSNSIVDSSTTSNDNNTTSLNPSSSQISVETSSLESNNSFVSSNDSSSSNNVSSNSSITSSSNNSSSMEVSYDGYYSGISPTLSGESLQKALTSLISKNYHDLGYDGLLTAYRETDCKPNTNIIWDMYSNENFVCGGDKENHQYKKEGDGYNREHSIPQSYFSEQRPMKSDLFHVYPTDGYVNNRRSNFPYGEVSNYSYISNNGSKLGPSSFPGYSGTVFEPIDEYKGDFARTYFYFATRYPAKATKTANGAVSFSTSYPYLTKYAIDLFTKWSEDDPISQKEIDRNNAVYKLQKNRNPFIDHPEFINKIFGGNTSIGNDVDIGNKDEENKSDQEYADEVISLINSIGTVTSSSGASISKASNAYDKLSDTQKALVTNYQILLDAKEAYKEFGDTIGEKLIFNMVYEEDKDTFKDKSITFESNINANGNDNNRGVQFLNKGINASLNHTLVLTTNDYANAVSTIKLTCASNAANFSSIKLKVFVGESRLSSEVDSLTQKESTEYLFTSDIPLNGEIRIEVTSTLSSNSFYISTIEIN